MKKKDLMDIIKSLIEVSDLKGVKFAYTLIKNKKKIEEEIKNLEGSVKPSEEFEAFEKKRIAMCEEFSEKDQDGKAVIEDNKYKILDKKKFEIAFTTLKDENEAIISQREGQINEYNSLLEEDTEIVFDKIGISDLPEDITAAQIDAVDFMVKWD